jgi:hypothetical protein
MAELAMGELGSTNENAGGDGLVQVSQIANWKSAIAN